MYKDSSIQENYYFFCVTGLNITAKLIQTLNDTVKLDDALLEHFDDLIGTIDVEDFSDPRDKSPAENQIVQEAFFEKQILLPLINHLYFIVFKLFNQSWVDQKPGIMKFTQFLHVIYEEQFLGNINDIISEYVY